MISGLPCRCNNTLNFREKSFITLSILLVLNQIWYQDVPYMFLNVCQIWRQFDYVFAFYGFFCKCAKKRRKRIKNRRKWATFWRLGLVWSRDHGAMNACKIVLCSLCQYTYIVAHAPFSWAARHTTMCLDISSTTRGHEFKLCKYQSSCLPWRNFFSCRVLS